MWCTRWTTALVHWCMSRSAWSDDQESEAELNLMADQLQVRVDVCSGRREECVCVCACVCVCV